MNMHKAFLGNAGGSRACLKAWPLLRIRCSGGPPKQAFLLHRRMLCLEHHKKVLNREDAFASARNACALQIT